MGAVKVKSRAMSIQHRGRVVQAAVCCVAALAVTAGASTAGAATTPHADNPAAKSGTPPVAADKIKPKLQRQLDSKGQTSFWVRFENRADLTEASSITDWAERGTAVADALQRTAEESQADVRARLEAARVEHQAFWATNAIHIPEGTSDLAERISAQPEVDALYPSRSYDFPEPRDGRRVQQAGAVEWGIADINADDVWSQYGVSGEGIVVANIDTGVQYDHPALVEQYRGNNGDGTFDHDYNWFDASGRCDGAPCDPGGHGTHTMGTMVGSDGGDNRIGVAPDATWIAANGCCPSDAALIDSGQWMLEPRDLAGQNPDAGKRPHIINNSWGSQYPSNDPFMEDITRAWTASGIFSTWSNGNIGPGCDTSSSPGSLISNYSTGAYDIDNEIAGFSSRGTGQGGETKPDIAAPGVDVRSAWPESTYRSASGTSMAAPHVAGTVALAWAAAPALVGDVDDTKALLDGSAVDSPSDICGGTDDDNNVFGEGRLDALALLDSAPVGDTGTLVATVTDEATGEAVPGAEITIEGPVDRERTAGEDGTYSLPLPVGDYTVTASAFGYAEQIAEVTITADETTTRPLALVALDTVTVSGRVTDGSGQGWPLYAEVTVDGVPDGTFHTDPVDGRYSFSLPANASYSVSVEPEYGGYQQATAEIVVEDQDLTRDFEVLVAADSCTAAGYRHAFDGASADFEDGLPDGWSVVDNNGSGYRWAFDDPYDEGNRTGGEGSFAVAQSPGPVLEIDTSMLTRTLDLTGHESPIIRFRHDSVVLFGLADVDLSVDGGVTWETVLHLTDDVDGPAEEVIPIPQAANEPAVQVRFRFYDAPYNSRWWQVDDVFVGARTCAPTEGGLVLGQVRDRNTDDPLNGAGVSSDTDPEQSVESMPTPDDPTLSGGFYWMFAAGTGEQGFTASADRYHDQTERATVQPGTVTQLDFTLGAGQLSVDPAEVSATTRLGRAAERSFTVTNTGTAPAAVELTEQQGSVEVLRPDGSTVTQQRVAASEGAKVRRVEGDFSPLGFTEEAERSADAASSSGRHGPTAAPWVDLPDYPTRIMDNAVGEHKGRIYSVGGVDGFDIIADGHVYDPGTQAWSPIADLPQPREAASGAFIGDLFYVVGGWGHDRRSKKSTFVYDPAVDSWSSAADAPVSAMAAGRAVLDGQLYLVGGCTNACGMKDVRRYDPKSDTWETLADYPVYTSHLACAGLEGQLYCAGGIRRGGTVWNHTYAYDPSSNTWTRRADMPISLWGMGYTGSYGQLHVSGGSTGDALTNEGFSYDPETDSWLDLPASNNVLYRGGSACGLSKVGGARGSAFNAVVLAEQLPTYGQCAPADVSWMSLDSGTATLAPGEELTVTVHSSADVAQPGTYTAGVWIGEDTPYLVEPVDVTMHVDPPLHWAALTGTVAGVSCDSATRPLGGATVQLDSRIADISLATTEDGSYARWPSRRNNPVTVTVSKSGFEQQQRTTRLVGRGPTVEDFALHADSC